MSAPRRRLWQRLLFDGARFWLTPTCSHSGALPRLPGGTLRIIVRICVVLLTRCAHASSRSRRRACTKQTTCNRNIARFLQTCPSLFCSLELRGDGSSSCAHLRSKSANRGGSQKRRAYAPRPSASYRDPPNNKKNASGRAAR